MKRLGFGLSMVLAGVLAAFSAQAPMVRKVHLMGTTVTLETFATERTEGLQQLEALVQTLEEVEDLISTWRPDSALSRLNRRPTGVALELEEPVCELLADLRHWTGSTEGAFDPAVGRLIDAWGLQTKPRQAASAEIIYALERSGMDLLDVHSDSTGCRAVRTADLRIDAGAFGKGAALRTALREMSLSRYPWIVNVGGQVAVQGLPPGKDSWEISIAHPADRSRGALTLDMRSGSMATSGGSESDVTVHTADGRRLRIGHILDPRTGRPVVSASSVSVWHSDPLAADVLSTALYVMGIDLGLRFANQRGLAACFLTPDGDGIKEQASDAFAAIFLPYTNRPVDRVLSPSPDL